jgi:hypothetical protein
MNEMNELETQLRSWAPRPPSAKISSALFGRDVALGASSRVTRHPSPPLRWTWLAPGAAAFALMFVLLHQPGSAPLSHGSGSYPIIAVILSNQSAASMILADSNREPVRPAANGRAFELNGDGSAPKAFGVATSAVSTGASERLPGWRSKDRTPAEGRGDCPATNGGARIAPQASMESSLRLYVEHQPRLLQAKAGLGNPHDPAWSPFFQSPGSALLAATISGSPEMRTYLISAPASPARMSKRPSRVIQIPEERAVNQAIFADSWLPEPGVPYLGSSPSPVERSRALAVTSCALPATDQYI